MLQLVLQALIMATGNYNFFNALTALLCLTLLPSTTPPAKSLAGPSDAPPADDPVVAAARSCDSLGPFVWAYRAAAYMDRARWVRVVTAVVNAGFHVFVAIAAFEVVQHTERGSDDSWLHRTSLQLAFKWDVRVHRVRR